MFIISNGIVGSILAKEGHMPNLSDFVSGAFKFAFRQLKHDDSTPSGNKPGKDYLMAQVNSLRQELQILASNRPVTIVTGRGSGSSKYRIIIVVVVVGYGYVWWKGWRLPDMMFATRRSLSDARDAIAKQLDSATRRHLSSRIEGVDNHLNEIADIAATTQDEVSLLQDKSKMLNSNVQSVRYVVQTLESKINRIEGKQDMTNEGVNWLCDYAQTMEQNRPTDRIQAAPASSSRPALEAPTRTPSRTGSLPPIVPVDLPAPDSNGTHMVKRSPRNAVSASGLKEVGESSSNDVGNGIATSEDKTNGSSSSSGFSRMMFSGGNGSLLTRTCSATNAVPQQM
ncbi:ATP-dependent helicase/deoxyribonuclease subunit B [Gossypium australe]|uniref:ATP-dependent helicase/deoxyribonuclease subunit B n=1 Tax=Gossypium australe TaxID=47621 RepID=A0A5B6WPJ5_9ROSI|nr:ATP-dependent helicase/deoxyribonuclease subunit B [Gossypium australe]